MCWLRRAGLGLVVVVAAIKKHKLAPYHASNGLKRDEI